MTTLPGQPAIMTPFAASLSQATGWPILTVLMTQVPAWGLLMFPYQAPPLVATRALSDLPVRKFVRLLVPFAVFGWLRHDFLLERGRLRGQTARLRPLVRQIYTILGTPTRGAAW